MQTRTIRILLVLAVVSGFGAFPTVMQTVNQDLGGIDGTYVFVSETATPERGKEEVREAPEWKGLYIFQDGTYSISIVRGSRNDDWMAGFPKNYQELGYESEAGTYQVKGSNLRLEPKVSLHPFGYQPRGFVFQLDGDRLILKSRMPTHSKRIPSGDIVTVLRRVSSERLTSF